MTREQAIIRLNRISNSLSRYCDVNDCIRGNCAKCYDALNIAIEALEQEPKWIPISWHEITEEERIENGYPKDWVVYLDCTMPSDEQEILVTTRYGTVEKDVCYEDGEFSLDSGYDWIDDIIAWMPLPEPYKESETE